ncbi:MAG: prepilin-type N-terminal cleavage/methylation domain-containing protein [Planctomycetota bacterium]
MSPFSRAFSLVELVIVVAIIATFAAIAAPRYVSSLLNYRVDAAANRIVTDLRLAQHTARTTSSSRSVRFDLGMYQYAIPNVRALNGKANTYTVNLREEPYRAKISSAVLGADAVLIYNGYGLPDSGGAIEIQVGDRTRTIVINETTGEGVVQ